MDLTERYEWRGRQIAWGCAGEGPAVVFCHGTPWWRDLVAFYRPKYLGSSYA